MTFDENTALPVQTDPISFLKLGSMELNLSNKVLKVRIVGFYEAVSAQSCAKFVNLS